MRRSVYQRSVRPSMRPAIEATIAVLALGLLPWFVESFAQSDLLGPLVGWTVLSAIGAFLVWAWPVKR